MIQLMIKVRGDLLELVGKLALSDMFTKEQTKELMNTINLLESMIDAELPSLGLTTDD